MAEVIYNYNSHVAKFSVEYSELEQSLLEQKKALLICTLDLCMASPLSSWLNKYSISI